MALGAELIDPASFHSIRLVGGALLLWPLARWSQRGVVTTSHGTWASATALFIYALTFLAWPEHRHGRLILFGMVQMSHARPLAVRAAAGPAMGGLAGAAD